VLESVALEDDARAVAKAWELLWLKLTHCFDVRQGELVHVVNLARRQA
jgi:hypothetical protein